MFEATVEGSMGLCPLDMCPHEHRSRHARRLGLLLIAVVAMAVLSSPNAYATTGVSAVSWGEDEHTELGAGYLAKFEDSPVAVTVSESFGGAAVKDITELATGKQFSLALLESGRVLSWGWNEQGQLGDGTKGYNGEEKQGTWEKGKVDVFVSEVEREGKWEDKPLENVTAISANGEHGLALLSNGHLVAWGDNEWGQLGNGRGGYEKDTGEIAYTPKEVVGKEGKGKPENIALIASGGEENFAVLSGGKEMLAWGGNKSGQLGIGELGPEKCIGSQGELNSKGEHEEPCSTYPRLVKFPSVLKEHLADGAHITAVSAFGDFTLMLLSDGEVWSWGDNGKGALGTGGSTKNSEDVFDEPQQVKYLGEEKTDTLGPAVAIAAGKDHALALLTGGEVVAWGDNEDGDLGRKTSEECQKTPCSTTPVKAEHLESVTSIAAGLQDSFAVSGGRVYSFGDDVVGELGNGTTNESANSTPTAIAGVEHVGSVSAGNLHTAALLQSGVAPPAPLASLKPGLDSLDLSWTFKASEYKTRVGKFVEEKPRSPEWGKITTISATENKKDYEASEFLYSGLTPVLQVVKLVGGEQELLILGLPE